MFCTKCNLLRNASTRFSSTTTGVLKRLEDMPSPKGFPLVGTILSLVMAGSYPKLHYYIDKRHKQLGPIFREKIGPVPCLFISDPSAIRRIFANEGKYPIHVLPEAWTTYNTMHGVSRGLFFMDGEEWLRFRKILNPLLLKADQTWLSNCCYPSIENLLTRIKELSESDRPVENIEKLLYKWSMEVMVSVLVDHKNYRQYKDQLDERISYLASSINSVFETSSQLALIPSSLASKFRIPRWKKFENSVSKALSSTSEVIQLLYQNYAGDEGLLCKFKEQMTVAEMDKIATDMMLAAGDTTAYSMEWLLYLVGKHQDVQERLRQEIMVMQNEGKSVTSSPFLKSIVKESLRLYPVAPFLTRINPEPMVLENYSVPAGTVLIMSIFTTGRDEKNFSNPSVFDPDRWATEKRKSALVHSAALPFAIGARSCVGRRLAEAQLQITLAEIVRNFRFKVMNEKEIDITLKMVAVPSEKLRIKFKNIK